MKWPKVLISLMLLAAPFAHADQGETLVLPISRNFDQGSTGLCWDYAMMSSLETRYMVLHPGEKFELSRGILQYEHFLAKAQENPVAPLHKAPEDGYFGEAIDLIRTFGAAPFDAYPDAKKRNYESLRSLTNPAEFLAAVQPMFAAIPEKVQWRGRALSPVDFANEILGQDHWTDIAVARHGEQGLGQNPDPGAAPGKTALYLPLEQIVTLIKTNLQKGIPTAYATDTHSMLIYGARYDANGQAVEYLIKDSFMGLLYKANAYQIHNMMNLVNTIY